MTDRRPFVAGNWKLHKTVREATQLARDLKSLLAAASDVEVGIAPVFTALSAVKEALAGSRIRLAAQNLYFEDQGAFTGEVSAPLLADVGCQDVIIGHSERRQLFGETDDGVRRKVRAAISGGLRPIVCVGETIEQREAGHTQAIVLGQLDAALLGLSPAEIDTLVIAYEPVWAIGTGRTASPGDAQEVHAAIRSRVSASFGRDTADGVRVLYGGSVKPDNARDLMAQPDIDGALVGGASLTADSFAAIVRAAE